ncbi:MAG: MarR family transcriptional regulator [Clostridiaceae bacterium]|nr:MarR family transcriptional regulator [Eubacteriales bacterium]
MEALMRFVDRTTRCAVIYRSEKLEAEGLNGCQHTYILNICREPGISQERLASRIYVNRSSVTRQLALLEQNGFVERRPSESDKRVMEVFPTQKAFDVYPRVREVLSEWNTALLEQFTPEERKLLSTMMERVMVKAVEMSGADKVANA